MSANSFAITHINIVNKDQKTPPLTTAVLINPSDDNHRKGGIDMDGRLMDLGVTQAPGTDSIILDQMVMPAGLINGVVPHVSSIVAVTPALLQVMLGDQRLALP